MASARQSDPQQTPLRLLTYTESLRQRLNPVISVPQPAAAQINAVPERERCQTVSQYTKAVLLLEEGEVRRVQAATNAITRLNDENCGDCDIQGHVHVRGKEAVTEFLSHESPGKFGGYDT